MKKVKTNHMYRHFKGMYVYVKEIAKDSETLENMVIYNHIGTDEIWVRSEAMFLEEVDPNRSGNITGQLKRFELVEVGE